MINKQQQEEKGRRKIYSDLHEPSLFFHKKNSLPKIDSLIQKKISSYVHIQIRIHKKLIDSKKSLLNNLLTKNFPKISSLQYLVAHEKEISSIYKQKMELNCEQCFLFFLQIIQAAINHQLQISGQEINKNSSLLIDVFLFVAESLVQIGVEKLSFYFCVKTIQLCEIYKSFFSLGHSLYLIGIILRKLSKFDFSIIFLKKALEYLWIERKKVSSDLELEVYNQLSYDFLQLNLRQQSEIFAFKYEIGYLERENSKIINLSNELVTSVQKRKPIWHSISEESLQLILSFQLAHVIVNNKQDFSGRIDQNRIMNVLKINFDLLFDNLRKNDMFFYQIPLPLEILNPIQGQNIQQKEETFGKVQKGDRMKKERKISQKKFVMKKKSLSMDNLKVEKQNQKTKEQIIFNYRGIKFSKRKLVSIFDTLMSKIKSKIYVQNGL